MANDSNSYFYWYRRYKVRAQDMNDFQTGMVETARGLSEGVMGAAVLSGFQITPSALNLTVGTGIATSASGYLEVMNQAVVLDVSAAASGSLPCRSLVVVTPDPTDANFINSPTAPFNSVPLNQLQRATVQLIPGTPSATPEYPAKGQEDVILCGLIVPPGTVNITSQMLDFEVRESIGVNSQIAQNQVRFDNRLRPYRSSAKVMGVKPSQNIGSAPMGFSYPGRLTPSRYPLMAGSFSPSDSFIDFSTGMITGGDTTTPTFSPQVPINNLSKICLVTLTQLDTLQFNFGPDGGYAQCLNAIQNQIFTGAGSLPAQDGNFPVAFVILTALGGTLSDVQVMDARAFLGSGAAAAKFVRETPTGAVNGSNTVFTLANTPSDPESLSFYVDENLLTDNDFELSGNTVTITNPDFVPELGQSVYAVYIIFGAVINTIGGGGTGARFFNEVPSGVVDGVNADFGLTNTPIDPESIFFYVDENILEATDFTLSGNTITITNPDFIPLVGQTVYTKYLYAGIIPGGGGGGGTSGYAAVGSRPSPHIVTFAGGITPTSAPLQKWFVRSTSGIGFVSASPQIGAGDFVGQKLEISIVNPSNYPVFQDGNGLLLNGTWPATGGPVDGATILTTWDGAFWAEDTRR